MEMIVYGHLVYFIEECPRGSRERIILEICAYLNVTTPIWHLSGFMDGPAPVRRSTRERRAALSRLRSLYPTAPYYRDITPEYDIAGEMPSVEMGSPAARMYDPSIDDAMAYLTKYPTICAHLNQKFTVVLADGLDRDMPPGVVGNAYFSEASLVVGDYDVFEVLPIDVDPPAIHYFGRSQCAIRLESDTTPPNPAEYQKRVFEIPEFMKLQADLEAIMGPVKRCLYWQA